MGMEKVKQIGPFMEEKVPLGTPTTVTHQIRWEIRQDNQEKDSLKHSKKKKRKRKKKRKKNSIIKCTQLHDSAYDATTWHILIHFTYHTSPSSINLQ